MNLYKKLQNEWFSVDSNWRLVDTIHGVGLGINFIVT